MSCTIHTYLLNDHFSPEYANEHNNGEESELNRKYQWEDELSVSIEIVGVKEEENGVYNLRGTMPDGKSFSHEISAMRLFKIETSDGVVAIGCSESILSSCELEKREGDFFVKLFIKDNEPFSNPVAGIYVAAQEFPKELIV